MVAAEVAQPVDAKQNQEKIVLQPPFSMKHHVTSATCSANVNELRKSCRCKSRPKLPGRLDSVLGDVTQIPDGCSVRSTLEVHGQRAVDVVDDTH